MRIVAATTRGGLDDAISPVFGRCTTFTVVDVEGDEIVSHEVIQNPYAGAMGGAGIQAAQLVLSKGAQAVLAGSFGPNASNVLSQGGVSMVPAQGTVQDKARDLAAGRLSPSSGPTAGAFTGRGMGMGMGRGMGRGMGMMMSPPPPPPGPASATAAASLSEELRALSKQIEALSQRLARLEGGDDK